MRSKEHQKQKDKYEVHKDTLTHIELQQGPYNIPVKEFTPEQKEQMQSEYHALRLKMEEKYRREQEWMVRYWEDKTNDDVN